MRPIEMKVIETNYKGIMYRSRVEARWAVFFDILRIPFDYEPEAFSFGGVGYLPDFLLPMQDCYVEIKGRCPEEAEKRKARALAQFTGIEVYIFWGNPKIPMDADTYSESAHLFLPDGGEDLGYWWCRCPHCHLLGIQFNGRADRLRCKCPRTDGDKGYSYDAEPILKAYQAACAFRFEDWRKTNYPIKKLRAA